MIGVTASYAQNFFQINLVFCSLICTFAAMMKINWLTLVLKLIAVYGLYLIVLDMTTSKTSAFCMALGVMLLLVIGEGLLENYLKERRERKEKIEEPE